MLWAYGVTTVPSRRWNYLPPTLESLKKAGFDDPVIFVDGPSNDFNNLDLRVVYRRANIRAFGNWILALWELWVRNPEARYYAIFQDDFVAVKNLRRYLEHYNVTDHQYLNLYTFPENEAIRPSHDHIGWYESNQLGRGAVALVFPSGVVEKILTSRGVVVKCKSGANPHRSIDGCLCDAMKPLNVKELVHYPTLVQHEGDCSAIGNRQHVKPRSWLGEDFDAMEFLGVHSK